MEETTRDPANRITERVGLDLAAAVTALAGLEDTARVLRQLPTGRRVEGTPQLAEATGPTFPCRLSVRSTAEEIGAAPGDRRVVTRGRATCGPPASTCARATASS